MFYSLFFAASPAQLTPQPDSPQGKFTIVETLNTTNALHIEKNALPLYEKQSFERDKSVTHFQMVYCMTWC